MKRTRNTTGDSMMVIDDGRSAGGRAPARLGAAFRRGAAAALAAACVMAAPAAAQFVTPEEEPRVDARPLRNDELLRLALSLNHPRRKPDYRRDVGRNPYETLSFFRIRPDMTVAEAAPDEGWYTRVLGPYLADKGRYVALNPSTAVLKQVMGGVLTPEERAEAAAFPATWPAAVEAMLAGSEDEGLEIHGAYFLGDTPADLDGAVDAVLFIRALHHMKRFGAMDAAIAETASLLKPGGLVGVVQHRAKADAPDAYADGSKGYLREIDVIAAFEAAGFTLLDRSDVNANPKDPADWPYGAWTLPPRLITGADEERYRAIGESDRMTLLFQKTDEAA